LKKSILSPSVGVESNTIHRFSRCQLYCFGMGCFAQDRRFSGWLVYFF